MAEKKTVDEIVAAAVANPDLDKKKSWAKRLVRDHGFTQHDALDLIAQRGAGIATGTRSPRLTPHAPASSSRSSRAASRKSGMSGSSISALATISDCRRHSWANPGRLVSGTQICSAAQPRRTQGCAALLNPFGDRRGHFISLPIRAGRCPAAAPRGFGTSPRV